MPDADPLRTACRAIREQAFAEVLRVIYNLPEDRENAADTLMRDQFKRGHRHACRQLHLRVRQLIGSAEPPDA